MTATAESQKLPLWRLIAALFVLGSLVAVLLVLAPVYLDSFRLGRYLRDLTRRPAGDEVLRSQVLARARQLDLPVTESEVAITHDGGKLHVDIKYAVEMNLPVYRVDLHFHSSATGP